MTGRRAAVEFEPVDAPTVLRETAGPFFLDCCGVILRVDCGVPWVRAQLLEDFKYFKAAAPARGKPALSIRCIGEPGDRSILRSCRKRWTTNEYSAYDAGGRRWVDYCGRAALPVLPPCPAGASGRALACYDFAAEAGTIWSEERDLLREIAYLMIHSRLGEKLDARGLHRVHALGFSFRGGAGLCVAPPGGGKSTLCLDLLGRQGFRLFSDDTPLADRRGNIHPFPLRIGLAPSEKSLAAIPARFQRIFRRRRYGEKIVLDFDYFSDKIAPPQRLRWLFALRRTEGPPRIAELGRFGAFRLLWSSLLIGRGLPQVLEYFLRLDGRGLLEKIFFACSRLRVLWALLDGPERRIFFAGPDRRRNVEALERFLLASAQSKEAR